MVVNDLIIDLGLPVSIVDHPTFIRAMSVVDSRFTLLSRRTPCRTVLPSALEQVMLKLKQACNKAQFLSLTLDVWTDRRVRAFLAVTMHTVNEISGGLDNYLLSFQPLSGTYTVIYKFELVFST